MTRRWQLILPVVGLLVFAALTYHSVRMNRELKRGHSRYFYWSSLPLDSEPSKGRISTNGPCNNSDPTCVEFDPAVMWVEPGWLTDFLVLTAAPAFLLGGLMVSALARLGVSKVFGFFAVMPFLLLAWYCFLGWLLDGRRNRRFRKVQASLSP